MQYKLNIPKTINTTIQLPSSKSISNRVLIIHALSKGNVCPENVSDCDDTRVMIKALSGNDEVVDIMAAGTSMRFLTAYYSITPGTRVITGTERMKHRPVAVLIDALRELGAEIECIEHEGFPPLRITGQELDVDEISLRGNVSSQYISALLMIAPYLKNGLHLFLMGEIVSRPYINLTLHLMNDFGAEASWISDNTICVKPVPYKETPFVVESDWSAASYWYQMAALADEARITLPGLLENSYQGDRQGAGLFKKLGVHSIFTSDGVVITKAGSPINKLEEDFIDIPDLAQTFVVTCALMDIPFRFTGLQSLKIKETDRIAALIAEMSKLGYVLREEEDSVLVWNGERCAAQDAPVIRTYDDHRMAMAFAPAAMHYPQMQIADPQVVTKSYPGYWEELGKVGEVIEV